MESKQKLTCPACGRTKGVSIVYGFPSDELMDAEDRGEIALGGCCLPWQPAQFRCLACRHEWAQADDLSDQG